MDSKEQIKSSIPLPEDDLVLPSNLKLALENNYSRGNILRAKELVTFFKDAEAGTLAPIVHNGMYYKLRGGENYHGVSCYIDSLLVAMFARLESFEPILYRTKTQDTPDESKELLAIMLRLYVNLLRSGKFLSTDITKCMIGALRNAGWVQLEDADHLHQQDTSELFTFITDKLDMPLLTLKMEIAHGGKEDKEDDHRLIHENMLLLSIPGESDDEPLLLEECLESYFSNSIEVTRQLERRMTLESSAERPGLISRPSFALESRSVKDVMTSTVDSDYEESSRASSRISSRRNSLECPPPAYESLKPLTPFDKGNEEADLRDTKSIDGGLFNGKPNPLWNADNKISLPAWMFYQLLPFYTSIRGENKTEGQAQVSQHFANSRPVLVMCLKRYSYTPDFRGRRNSRQVIVPQTINLPSFVADDTSEGNAFGNFRLELESAVFHRGEDLTSGHYIALVSEDSTVNYDDTAVATVEQQPDQLQSAAKQSKMRAYFRKSSGSGARDGEDEEGLTSWEKQKRTFFSDNSAVKAPPKSTVEGEAVVATTNNGNSNSSSSLSSRIPNRRWLLYDNVAYPRVKEVDFDETFERECPYLLFYRMVPISEAGESSSDLTTTKTDSAGSFGAVAEQKKSLANLFSKSSFFRDASSNHDNLASTPNLVLPKKQMGSKLFSGYSTTPTTPRRSMEDVSSEDATGESKQRLSLDIPVVDIDVGPRVSRRRSALIAPFKSLSRNPSPSRKLGVSRSVSPRAFSEGEESNKHHRMRRKRREYRSEKCILM
ncbi:hypothetical protein TRVA0_001S10660 [Trichomonascus vanleenenianus]|uniref:uncharacterized protein n=1 Tax=Trichomonascus vanleenenianus TaxID=2268995 RepID=UPI003ECB0492